MQLKLNLNTDCRQARLQGKHTQQRCLVAQAQFPWIPSGFRETPQRILLYTSLDLTWSIEAK